MGLFGSDDDTDEPESERGGSDAQRNAAPADVGSEPAEREPLAGVSDRVEAVLEAPDPQSEIEGLLDVLGGPERSVAAAAFGRVMAADQTLVGEETVEAVIERLLEREASRAIADGLLHQAESLRWSGVDARTIAEGGLDALEVALERMATLETAGGVPAGGGSEAALAAELRETAATVSGRKQLVYESTADALERVPMALAIEAGMDPLDTLVDMRLEYDQGTLTAIDTASGQLLPRAETGSELELRELRARLVDGVTLGAVVLLDRGTVSQLESLAGASIAE
jgi:hypothetical protein